MSDSTPTSRDLRSALIRGFKGQCPSCGDASLFGRFLKPVPRCPACGQDWTLQTADDLPAYLVVLLVGHLLVPFVVTLNLHADVSTGVQMLLWPTIALIMSVALIQPAKGAVIALQWARHMQGFAPKAR
jgi:uncharacterized protein (DUF983 family)